jgi:hypothetical protein
MMKHVVLPSEIWVQSSEIWPDFAKSGPCAKSGIWLFSFSFRGLLSPFQISGGRFRNLLRNLEKPKEINGLCQISDFRKITPKGVGDLPAIGGGDHHLPLGHLLGPEFWSEINPTTAAGTAKHQPPSSSTPSSPQQQETPHG